MYFNNDLYKELYAFHRKNQMNYLDLFSKQ